MSSGLSSDMPCLSSYLSYMFSTSLPVLCDCPAWAIICPACSQTCHTCPLTSPSFLWTALLWPMLHLSTVLWFTVKPGSELPYLPWYASPFHWPAQHVLWYKLSVLWPLLPVLWPILPVLWPALPLRCSLTCIAYPLTYPACPLPYTPWSLTRLTLMYSTCPNGPWTVLAVVWLPTCTVIQIRNI